MLNRETKAQFTSNIWCWPSPDHQASVCLWTFLAPSPSSLCSEKLRIWETFPKDKTNILKDNKLEARASNDSVREEMCVRVSVPYVFVYTTNQHIKKGHKKTYFPSLKGNVYAFVQFLLGQHLSVEQWNIVSIRYILVFYYSFFSLHMKHKLVCIFSKESRVNVCVIVVRIIFCCVFFYLSALLLAGLSASESVRLSLSTSFFLCLSAC